MDPKLSTRFYFDTFPLLERLVREVDPFVMSSECLIASSQYDRLEALSVEINNRAAVITKDFDLLKYMFANGSAWRVLHYSFSTTKKWLEYWTDKEDGQNSQSIPRILRHACSIMSDILSLIKVACDSEVKDQFLHSWNLFLQDLIKYDNKILSFPLLQPFTIFQALDSSTVKTTWEQSSSLASMILQTKRESASWSSLKPIIISVFSSVIIQKSLRTWISRHKWLPSSDFSSLGKIQRSTLKVLRIIGIAVQQEHKMEDWNLLASLLFSFLYALPLRKITKANQSSEQFSVLEQQAVEVLHMFLQLCFEASVSNSKSNSQFLQQDTKTLAFGTYELSERAVAAINLILTQSKLGLLELSAFSQACLMFRGRWLTPLFGRHRDLSELARTYNSLNDSNSIGKSLVFLFLQLSRAKSSSRQYAKTLLVLLSNRRTPPILLLEDQTFVLTLLSLLAASDLTEERELLGVILSSQILHLCSRNEPSLAERQLLVDSLNTSLQLLSHSSHSTRAAAAEAIGSLRQSSFLSQQFLQSHHDNLLTKLTNILLETCRHENGTIRSRAIGSLGDLARLEVQSWSMIISQQLEKGLQDAKLTVRIDAAWALSKYITSKWVHFIIKEKEGANIELLRQEAERWSAILGHYLAILASDSEKLKPAVLRGISGLLLTGMLLQQCKMLTSDHLSHAVESVDRLLFPTDFNVDELINSRSRDLACAIAQIFCTKILLYLTCLPVLYDVQQLTSAIKMLDQGFPQLQVQTAQLLYITLELTRRSKVSLQPVLHCLSSALLRLIDPNNNQHTQSLDALSTTNNTGTLNTEIQAVKRIREVALYRMSLLLCAIFFQQVNIDSSLDHNFLMAALKHHLNGFVNEVEPKCKRAQSFKWLELMGNYELFSQLQMLPCEFPEVGDDRILGRSAASAILSYLYRDYYTKCTNVRDKVEEFFDQSSSITNQIWSSSLLLRLQSLAEQQQEVQKSWGHGEDISCSDPDLTYSSFSGLLTSVLMVKPPRDSQYSPSQDRHHSSSKLERNQDPDEI